MWRGDISCQEFLDDKEVKDSIANDMLDDEEQEILTEAQNRVRYGPETQEFEDAVNSLYSTQQMVMDKKRRLSEIKADHRDFMIIPAKEVCSAASFLQNLQSRIDLHDPMPLVELEQSMQEFCAGQYTEAYTKDEKAACTVIQGVLPTLENKRKAIEELLLGKDTLLKEKLILCTSKWSNKQEKGTSANQNRYSHVQSSRCAATECS